MPIEPIKIPQNVYIEDRIVGPLTLKQLIISTIGCGFSYALFAVLSKAMGGTPPLPVTILVWIPGALSILFAFVRINDLSMLHLLLLLVEKANKPATRIWAPRRGITINFRTTMMEKPKAATPQTPEHSMPRIDELSSILDLPSAASIARHTHKEEANLPGNAQEEEAPSTPRPVDPSRIAVTPLQDTDLMDITPAKPAAPTAGTVSIFRDLSPRRA